MIPKNKYLTKSGNVQMEMNLSEIRIRDELEWKINIL